MKTLSHAWSPSAYTQYKKEGFLQILSMKKEAFCEYSVWKRRLPAYTQCKIGGFPCILSIKQNLPSHNHHPELYWVYAGRGLFHTEFTQDVVFSYWVYAGRCLNYTKYKLEANFAFGQKKSPLTHLNWLFIEKSLQGGGKGTQMYIFPKKISPNLKFSSHPAYTEYTQDKPSSHHIGSIKKMFVPG